MKVKRFKQMCVSYLLIRFTHKLVRWGGGGSTIQGASVRSLAADYNVNMSLAAVSLGLGDNYDNMISTLNILTYSLLILYYLYI